MNKHLEYLKYLLRHKYYVFIEGLKIGVPIERLIFHDWDKFLPSEWFAYVNTFYGRQDLEKVRSEEFDRAWLFHQKNKHHWEYWCLVNYKGEIDPIQMPNYDLKEMLADWSGASLAKRGKNDIITWYEKHKKDIVLHPFTRNMLEVLLEIYYK